MTMATSAAPKPDRQRCSRAIDHPAQHVAAQIIGAEPMRRTRQASMSMPEA
jgi:hypothetical protein